MHRLLLGRRVSAQGMLHSVTKLRQDFIWDISWTLT